MGEDLQEQSLSELIAAINEIPAISADGLKNAMFPDDLIASLHNHLGNANQFVSSSKEAMNGAEQFMAQESAQKELGEVDSDLFKDHQTHLISDAEYNRLAAKVRRAIELLSDAEDPEYT